MLLIRRLDPREAVRQTHLVAPFTAGERVKGSRFDALGLDVLMPDSVRSKTSTEPDSPAVEKADR